MCSTQEVQGQMSLVCPLYTGEEQRELEEFFDDFYIEPELGETERAATNSKWPSSVQKITGHSWGIDPNSRTVWTSSGKMMAYNSNGKDLVYKDKSGKEKKVPKSVVIAIYYNQLNKK